MRQSAADGDDFSLPMTPLIDVVFNLLIFFLLATTIAEEEADLSINLPPARHAEAAAPASQPLVIDVHKDGSVSCGGRDVTIEGLGEELRQVARRDPVPAVILRGDRDAPYGQVARVFDVCRGAGLTKVNARVRVETGAGE